MEPLNTFCLAALVFLSLPMPLFACVALKAFPAVRWSLMPWAWGNSFVLAVAGLLIVATPLPPWIALAVGATAFVVCGMQMFARFARGAAGRGCADS
ncbi:MAG: hypothetical protein FJ271_20805 [Planctomycetes bacterium]|nr:hypothetical protein [Planctomycetota bacterium]